MLLMKKTHVKRKKYMKNLHGTEKMCTFARAKKK